METPKLNELRKGLKLLSRTYDGVSFSLLSGEDTVGIFKQGSAFTWVKNTYCTTLEFLAEIDKQLQAIYGYNPYVDMHEISNESFLSAIRVLGLKNPPISIDLNDCKAYIKLNSRQVYIVPYKLSRLDTLNEITSQVKYLMESVMAQQTKIPDMVNHPSHYGSKDDPYEVIKVCEAWGLDEDAYLFNVVKYVARNEKKGNQLEDLKKARFYLDRKIKNLEQQQ